MNKTSAVRIILVLFIMSSQMVLAQRHHFISYSVKNGLAQSQVRDIIQSEDGYLWIATIGGVSKFDGKNFKNYNKSNGLLNNVITAIYETKDNRILIACQGGIVVIEQDRIHQYPFPEPFQETIVFDIQELNESIYLSTNGVGLFKWENGIADHFKLESPNENFIRTMENVGGELAIGTKQGLLLFDGTETTSVLDDISVNKIAFNNDEWWIATTKHGIIHISNSDTVYLTQENGISSLYQKDIVIDKLGYPWFISKNGIIRYDPKTKSSTLIQSTTPKYIENLKVIYCDNDNNIWVGSSGYGILKYTGDNTETFTIADGLSSDQIMSISETETGDIWFATYGDGVMSYVNDSFIQFNYDDGLRNNTVWSIQSIRDEVWIGSSDGINILNSGNLREFEHNDKLPFIRVSTIFHDNDSNIWIGTRDGLIRVHESDGQINTPSNILELNLSEVKSFCQIDHTIWISSRNGAIGLDSRSGEIQKLNDQSGLTENYISSITSDPNKNLWIGSDDGIYRYQPKKNILNHFQVSDLPSANIVTFLVHDSLNNLWIGTDNGLFSLNTKILDKSDSLVIKSYNEHDGIISQECNQNAAFCDSKGNLWFGLNGALIRISPESSEYENHSEYESVLQEVQVNFDIINPFDFISENDSIPVFPSVNNRFTFRYSAIQFSNPEKIRYSYKLVGSDEGWSPEVSENAVTYANLSPGSYEFIIRTRLENEAWGKPSKLLRFKISPPYYLTWWFILFVAFGIALCLTILIKFIQKQKQRKALLTDVRNRAKILGLEQENLNAHMNRHFIFNALNSIQYYINTQERVLANSYLTKFASLVRKNLDSAQSESISLHDELERLKLYLNLEQMRFKDRFEFRIETQDIEDLESIFVPSMILQPFVENSIMHGILPSENPGLINIRIEEKDLDIILTIEDNGIGIETSINNKIGSSFHVSNGMKITKQRLAVLKTITGKDYSVEGPSERKDSDNRVQGTVVCINLPRNTVKNLY